MILHESMYVICFMKKIYFADMIKLFYKFELQRKVFYFGL